MSETPGYVEADISWCTGHYATIEAGDDRCDNRDLHDCVPCDGNGEIDDEDCEACEGYGTPPCVAVPLYLAAEPRPLRAEVYTKQREKVHLDGDPLRVASTERVPEYRWRVVHTSNGEVMASGGGYANKRDRDHALALLHPDLEPVEVEG